jgi:hypothetical protein
MLTRLQRGLRHKSGAAMMRIKSIVPEPVKILIRRARNIRNARVSAAFFNSQMPNPEIRDEYQRLVAANVVGVLLNVMARFYSDLGVDAHSITLVKALESFRRTLPKVTGENRQGQSEPVLIRFERAFALSQANKATEALVLYESVFNDPTARKIMPYDPFVREAVVRSGEFIGRHNDKRGDAEAAIAVYREILSLERDGLVARRLVVLLGRRGDWREAAELSEMATTPSLNLFPHLPDNNPYIHALKARLIAK